MTQNRQLQMNPEIYRMFLKRTGLSILFVLVIMIPLISSLALSLRSKYLSSYLNELKLPLEQKVSLAEHAIKPILDRFSFWTIKPGPGIERIQRSPQKFRLYG